MRHTNLKGKKLCVIGLGNMGSALIGGMLPKKLLPRRNVFGCDVDARQRRKAARRFKIKVFADAALIVGKCDIILLAVKPQDFATVAAAIAGRIPAHGLVLSIIAGLPSAAIERKLGGLRVVRAMPNTPSLLGEGITAYCRGRHAARNDAHTAAEVFGAVGRTLEVKEGQMDLVTGLSGSGPAYFFLLVEALGAAGVRLGLSSRAAELLVSQTALGAARMVVASGEKPAVLRRKVTSKGGTTQAGLEVLKRAGFGRLVYDTVKAARERAKQLGREKYDKR